MNEHIFNEKESLELITQMIQKTRKELEVGSGNVFLCYGYTSVILAIAVYLHHALYHTTRMEFPLVCHVFTPTHHLFQKQEV